MAIKHIITRGIGLNPGTVKFIVTHGFGGPFSTFTGIMRMIDITMKRAGLEKVTLTRTVAR